MKRLNSTLLAAAVGVTLTSATLVAGGAAPVSTATPRWVLHVQHHAGGISNGVRASLDPRVAQAQAASRNQTARQAPAITAGPNVQMNDDSDPPLPQNETAVAYSTAKPLVAVAAANDYVSGGVVVMRTSDGGRHWASTRVIPQFSPTRDFCTGGDPSVAYSKRDKVFYLSQLCFFRELP